MKVQGIITIDSFLGKRLNLTSDLFDDAFVWDCRPVYLGVVRLIPQKGTEIPAYRSFLESTVEIYTPVRIIAPTPILCDVAAQYGYELKAEPCGTPYLTNEATKHA